MCAISGAVGVSFDRQTGSVMLETMKRRGPDGQGIYLDSYCMLLHTRLAIIDPAGGIQPMKLRWGEETYVISYNGELYNTDELRSTLIRRGHVFKTHSDTEVLLHAYCEWKDACLEKLNGIYAFAVWEVKAKRLFLARDRMGVKPLFYALRNHGIIFGSEIKTILAHPEMDAQLDAEGASELLLLGPGRRPGSGVLRGIQELEPGWCGYFENGKLALKQYWRLLDRIHIDSLEDTIEKVHFLVKDSIARQMVSDVSIGTFLSGGLDSSIITSVCARSQEEPLKTFSVDYENQDRFFVPGKFQPTYDSHYIRLMQEDCKTDHSWTVLKPEELYNALSEATVARDLPGMADVDSSLLLFCNHIRKDVKVALSGECADEIFGGYPWYRDPEIRDAEGFPWAQNTSVRASFLNPDLRVQNPEEFVMEQYIRTIRESDILPENSPQERRMKEMVNLNQRWFMQTLLDRKDRMSMYWGLEVRVPFCDHRIAEYLYSVPWEMKDLGGKEKGLLRTAMASYLPEEVLWRKKSPYPKTFDPRFKEIVRNQMLILLEDRSAPVFQLISKDAVKSYMEQESRWPWYGQLMRETQTMAYILQMDYWLRHYKVRLV